MAKKIENAKASVEDFMLDHPGIVTGVATVVGSAVGLAATIGSWKYFKRDTTRMYSDILRNSVFRVKME